MVIVVADPFEGKEVPDHATAAIEMRIVSGKHNLVRTYALNGEWNRMISRVAGDEALSIKIFAWFHGQSA